MSTDKGATWRVRYTFHGRRHGHSLVADPEQGVLWAMMGDRHGGLLRSVDDGATWKPVYSILRLCSGGYLLGTTREIDGDVYPDGDVSAHLLYSADGRTWKEFQAFPRQSPTEYAHVTAYWQLPSGEVVLDVTNLAGFGRGFFLLRGTLE